eukprot:6662201-Prymnesium_polylepis.1
MELNEVELVDALGGEIQINRVKRHYHETNYAYQCGDAHRDICVSRNRNEKCVCCTALKPLPCRR